MNKNRTGYSIYNKENKRRMKKTFLDDLYPSLPNKKYEIIYADPPWDYGGKLQFDKSSKSKEKINLKKNIFISSASFKYPTLKVEELKKLKVIDISDENCLLFMWTTSPHLKISIELGEYWGFKYRTVGFVWDKMVHNPGQYTLSNSEICLIFKKGKIPVPRGARNIQQLIRVKRGKHSQKPDEVRDKIKLMFPTQKKIELFSRSNSKDWDHWGYDLLQKDSQEQPSTLNDFFGSC